MASGHAGCNHTPSTLRTHNTCSGRGACLAETSNAAIGRVAQHGPDSRAPPPRAGLACRNALGVEPSGNLADAETFHRVHLINAHDHTGLGFKHNVCSRRLVSLANIAVAIRCAAHHANLTGLGAVSLAAARPLQYLCSFILRYHPLELHQKLIFRAASLRRLDKHRLDSVASQFLDQQNLVGILAAQWEE